MGGDRDGVGGERSQDLVPAEELLGRGGRNREAGAKSSVSDRGAGLRGHAAVWGRGQSGHAWI